MASKLIEYLKYKPILISIFLIIVISVILMKLLYYNLITLNYGFLFTPIYTILFIIMWDGYNSKKKEDLLFTNLELEFNINIPSLKENCKFILSDLQGNLKDNHVIIPLYKLRSEVWDVFKFNMPAHLFSDDDFIGTLTSFYIHVSQMNEIIKSRENFRINNIGSESFLSTIKKYNVALLKVSDGTINQLEIMLNHDIVKNKFNIKSLKSLLKDLKSENNKIHIFLEETNETETS